MYCRQTNYTVDQLAHKIEYGCPAGEPACFYTNEVGREAATNGPEADEAVMLLVHLLQHVDMRVRFVAFAFLVERVPHSRIYEAEHEKIRHFMDDQGNSEIVQRIYATTT